MKTMNAKTDLRQQIEMFDFSRISLAEAEKAKLMNRVDSKYVISVHKVAELLQNCTKHYYAVEINSKIIQDYESDYYDTAERTMFVHHQNKRPIRFKIRVRNYKASGDCFLEIKKKTATGSTIKMRIPCAKNGIKSEEAAKFVVQNSPFCIENLVHSLTTTFDRISLVSKTFDERVTLDLNLQLIAPDGTGKSLEQLCVVEIKRDKLKNSSFLAASYKELGIRQASFSKYSVGIAMLFPDLKTNSFKQILLQLNKYNHERAANA